MTNTAIAKKIAKLETQIEQKKFLIENAKADIKEATKEITNLRKKQEEIGYSNLREVIKKKGFTPGEVIELLK
jgi:peptidoglycan hydrolase CwlO-like protein